MDLYDFTGLNPKKRNSGDTIKETIKEIQVQDIEENEIG